MGDVLIKGMEMPKCCEECRLFNKPWCMAKPLEEWRTGYYEPLKGEKQKDCPLVEVPTPHGRLIDADAYRKEIRERYESAREWYKGAKTDDIKARAESALFTFTECSLTIRKMPTIIEAEDQ